MRQPVPEVKLSHILAGQFNALMLPRMLYCLDYRIAHYDRSVDPAHDDYNEHCILAFLHEYIVVTLPRWGRTPVTALCSLHRDGEWVNQTALALGLNVVRGSSSRGGAQAIRKIRENFAFNSLAMTPDGPRGPRRVMASGSIFMAAKLQVPLVMVGVGISNPYRLNTWDKFAIPKPLSRVRIIAGPKIRIPKKINRDQLESYRLSAETLLNDLCDEAQTWADSGEPMLGETICVSRRRPNKVFFDRDTTPDLGSGIVPQANQQSAATPTQEPRAILARRPAA